MAGSVLDVIIVGAGPAGLSAALVLGRCRRRVLVFDSGQPRNAAARAVHNYLGLEGAEPGELRARGREQVVRYGVRFEQDAVVAAERLPASPDYPFPTGFVLSTEKGMHARARKLLFATGMRDPLPDVPGIAECYGVTVHHCPYCDGWEHRDQRLVAYAKEAESAAGLGLSLRTWSAEVTVLSDGDRLSRRDKRHLEENGIKWIERPVERILAERGRLLGVEFDSHEILEADALFFHSTPAPQCDLPKSLGCSFSYTVARTRRKQKTNVKGLFLAGDADGDVQFAIVAAAEGATAATAINRELQDEDRGMA